MAFTGLSTNKLFTPSLVGEDISAIMATLTPVEAPLLDWLGDAATFAMSTKHEYIQDYLRPNYIIASTAVASATANTAFQVNGLGEALTVGTILENESAAPEVVQVVSIVGSNSIVVSRNYDGVGVGSLAAGGQFFVRVPAGLEGADHDGSHSARLGTRQANTVGLFQVPIATSGTPLYTDVRLFGAAGIPSAIYGAGPRTVFESNAKRSDEHLVLEDLRRATKVIARSLADLLA